MLTAGWVSPLELLQDELVQREFEGCRIPQALRDRIGMLHPVMELWNEAEIMPLYQELEALAPSEEFSREEPSEWNAIQERRPKNNAFQVVAPHDFSDDFLLDRFHGAWIGRSVGCALGKPVEGLGMCGGQWRDIRTYLQQRGDWPLQNYFSERKVAAEPYVCCPKSCRENIQYMESDDDIRYTLIGLMILEQYGKNFTWENIASLWNSVLPMGMTCTAERQAFLNYNMHIAVLGRKVADCATKEFTRRNWNPYREWIGAQIRGDFFGFSCAGNPHLAAEFAWRDASWTHTANGIYGEMLMAAMDAAAFVESDPRKLVEIALNEIPSGCRLALAIREAMTQIETCEGDWEKFMAWFELRWKGMSPVHTINNAVLCVAGLFFGKQNLDRSVCHAVMGGLDTDCNGATVGAIVGILSGADTIAKSSRLAPQLHDTICAEFGEFRRVTMTELAQRTLAVYRKIHK